MAAASRGGRWIVLQGLATFNMIIFVTTSVMISPHWDSINSYLGDATGLTGNYVLGIILVSLLPVAFSLTGLILSLRELIFEGHHKPRKRILVPSVIFAILFDFLLMLLVVIWGSDGVIVFNALEYQMPIIFLIFNIGFLIGLRSILPSLCTIISHIRNLGFAPTLRGGTLLAVVAVFWVGLIVAPMVIAPSNAYPTSLGQKPLLIAHRCGSYLGPENTLETAETALEYGIAGIEIDVQISSDGVPFLMHDDTLERTTNVAEVFPGRSDDNAGTFTIAELEQLDAGSWFVQNDPYLTIQNGFVSSVQADSYLSANVPTLQNATEFAADHDLILNVDFKEPSSEHPFYQSYLNICLAVLDEFGIDENIWVTARSVNWLELANHEYPDMITVLTIDDPSIEDVESLPTHGYDMLNTRMGLGNDIFYSLQSQDTFVSTWTVDDEFRFSQLWCLGVDSVTTNIPHLLDSIDVPMWSMPLLTYQLLWLAYGGLSFITIVYDHHRRGFSPMMEDM